MDRLEYLLRKAQAGEEEAQIALLAIFKQEMLEISSRTNNPRESFEILRNEFLISIISGEAIKLFE